MEVIAEAFDITENNIASIHLYVFLDVKRQANI